VNKTVIDLYVRDLKPLPLADKLRLLVLLAQDVEADTDHGPPKEHRILELEGLGAEIWQGIDAQEYVSHLRDEWEGLPYAATT